MGIALQTSARTLTLKQTAGLQCSEQRSRVESENQVDDLKTTRQIPLKLISRYSMTEREPICCTSGSSFYLFFSS